MTSNLSSDEMTAHVTYIEVAMNQAGLDRKRIAELEAALREARGMLNSCAFESPDDDQELVASWGRGLAKIDAALGVKTDIG